MRLRNATRVLTTAVLGGAFVVAGASAQQSSLRTVGVDDPATHMQAFTLQVPAGWKFTGVVAYPGGCHSPLIAANGLAYTALAPDGIAADEKLPGVSWAWATDGTNPQGPRCAPVKISTAEQFLLNIAIPNLRPDASNITVVPFTPKTQQELDAARRGFDRTSPDGKLRRTLDAAAVDLRYTLKGQPVQERLSATILCTDSYMPAFPGSHRPAVTRHVCQSTGTFVRRAPQGKLQALLAQAELVPVINPRWDDYVVQKMRTDFAEFEKANDAEFQAMMHRGKEFQRQQKSSFDNAMAQDRATQGAIDHAAQMQVRNSLNRADFIDPATGRKIETSNQYSHNWISSDGQSVVLSGDPTYDPNGEVDPVRQSWTELIPIN